MMLTHTISQGPSTYINVIICGFRRYSIIFFFFLKLRLLLFLNELKKNAQIMSYIHIIIVICCKIIVIEAIFNGFNFY